MARSFLFAFALAVAGCGPSFQEANAIYKDEVAKLREIEDERESEFCRLAATHFGSSPSKYRENGSYYRWLNGKMPPGKTDKEKQFDAEWDVINARFIDQLESQKSRVWEAAKAKEAAK